MKVQKPQNKEVLDYLDPLYKKVAKYMNCPKAQCSKLLDVYIQAYGVPRTQAELRDMISGRIEGKDKFAGGTGNPDLNRRCLICAYRAYRDLYYQKNGVYPDEDVSDDFDGDSPVTKVVVSPKRPNYSGASTTSWEEFFKNFSKNYSKPKSPPKVSQLEAWQALRANFVKINCGKFHEVVEFFMHENGFKLQPAYVDLFPFTDDVWKKVSTRFAAPEIWKEYEFFQILKECFTQIQITTFDDPPKYKSLNGSIFNYTLRPQRTIDGIRIITPNTFSNLYSFTNTLGMQLQVAPINGMLIGTGVSEETKDIVFRK